MFRMELYGSKVVVYVITTLWMTLNCDADTRQEPADVTLFSSSAKSTVPLTKCCTEGQFYNAGLDVCRSWKMTPEPEFPPVYSNDNIRLSIPAEEFSMLATNLSSCPDGHVVKTSMQFQLFENGTLITFEGRKQDSGDFCVEMTPGKEGHSLNANQPVFVARFCIPDPCNNDTFCVRKCCPNGMVVNDTDKTCQPSSHPFFTPFHNKSGVPVDSHPSLIVSDGVFVSCEHGAYTLQPSLDPEDEFYILPDGRIHVPSFPEADSTIREDYCVDHFTKEDDHVLHAILCFAAEDQSREGTEAVLSLYPFFLFASSFFLIVTFIVYALLPSLRNIQGVTLMCHIASMAVMYIGLGVIQLSPNLNNYECIGMAILVHFAFLSTFSWLNVMCFDLWWVIREYGHGSRKGHLGHRFVLYSFYAWTIPTVIVGVGQIIELIDPLSDQFIRPGFAVQTCWFHSRWSFIIYLYGPMGVMIFGNMFLFVATAMILCRIGDDPSSRSANLHFKKKKFRLILILFVLMGMSWMTEVVSFAVGGSPYFWIPTDILNILTGVFIFVIFVCNANVWSNLKNKYPSLKKFDQICPACLKYEPAQRDEDSFSNPMQHTAI